MKATKDTRYSKSGKITTEPPYNVAPFIVVSDENTYIPNIRFGEPHPLDSVTDEELTKLLDELAKESPPRQEDYAEDSKSTKMTKSEDDMTDDELLAHLTDLLAEF